MKAYELLSDESKWTKGTLATDADGAGVTALSKRATCWCMEGAILRCYRGNSDRMAALRRLESVVGRQPARANDAELTTFADVQRWLRDADV